MKNVIDKKDFKGWFKKRRLDKSIVLLMVLMFIDYIATYIGVNVLQCISEGNPLMVKLFDLPFYVSLVFRLAHMSLVYICLKYIKYKGHHSYKPIITFAICINLFLMFLHLRWIAIYIIIKFI